MKYKYIVGIDEVGRGPLAGPITVAAVALRQNFKFLIFNFKKDGLKDSKKLSAKQREIWFENIKNSPGLVYAVANVSNNVIDRIGIVKAIERAIFSAIKKLEMNSEVNHKNSFIVLDGLLKAPKEYRQKTIIKGDEKIPIISAASIVAKVSRDKIMVRLHKKYPRYKFENHKGYGTKLHYQMIKKYGLTRIHRVSFLKNFSL